MFIKINITYKRVAKVFVYTLLMIAYDKGFVTFQFIFQIIGEFAC